MPVKGTLKECELRVARMSFDFLKQPMNVDVLAALVDPAIGDTRAWVPANGVVWSKETAAALGQLVQCVERDIARLMMESSASEERGSTTSMSGIGEHVAGSAPDAPQM